MKSKILFISFFYTILASPYAQQQNDYILTLRKDTLFGEIQNRSAEFITFIYENKKVVFHASTLPSYGIYKNGKTIIYKAIKGHRGKMCFAQVLTEGKIHLYKYHWYNNQQFYQRKESLYLIGKNNQRLAVITSESYQLLIQTLLKDHPKLLSDLKRNSFEKMPALLASYNQY